MPMPKRTTFQLIYSMIEDFEEELDSNAGDSDLFDCEYSSVDALINEVIVFTGVKSDVQTENAEREHLLPLVRAQVGRLSLLIVRG